MRLFVKSLLLSFLITLNSSCQFEDKGDVTFKWDPAPEGEEVIQYRLWHKEAGVEAYSDYVEIAGDINAGTISNLNSDTDYTSVVTAINNFYLESGPSNEVKFTTK